MWRETGKQTWYGVAHSVFFCGKHDQVFKVADPWSNGSVRVSGSDDEMFTARSSLSCSACHCTCVTLVLWLHNHVKSVGAVDLAWKQLGLTLCPRGVEVWGHSADGLLTIKLWHKRRQIMIRKTQIMFIGSGPGSVGSSPSEIVDDNPLIKSHWWVIKVDQYHGGVPCFLRLKPRRWFCVFACIPCLFLFEVEPCNYLWMFSTTDGIQLWKHKQ